METGALISSPVGIAAILLGCVVAADRLGRVRRFRKIGAAFIVIILGALFANLRVIPSAASGGAVYDFIFDYVVSGAIFLLLLPVNLGALRRAGAPMLIAFSLGAAGVTAGVLLADMIVPMREMIGDAARPLGGMFAGTYVGGAANFNAVALAYGVARDSNIYTAATVVDNVMTDIWIVATLALPALLARSRFFGPARRAPAPAPTDRPQSGPTTSLDIGAPIALAAAALWVAGGLSAFLAARGLDVPPVLIVTTLALVAAQIPAVSRLAQAHALGLWGIYLFLAVVGANADLAALAAAGELALSLFAYVAIIFVAHAAILFSAGALLKLDPVVLAVASNACVGGSSTAFVLAETQDRDDLVLPAILVGSLGTALGTYLGVAVTTILH
jgi:uncharacterized membrane protein